MQKLLFKNSSYSGSFLNPKDISLPLINNSPKVFPEIPIVGRSNVGKSTLINHLTNQKIAKTSGSPGKTQTINFFLVDQLCYLVDLPGYGYAKVPKKLKKNWDHYLENYFTERQNISLILLLLDSRREVSEDDHLFIRFAQTHHLPLKIIFTKHDKLNQSEKVKQNHKIKELFVQHPLNCEIQYLYYSVKHPNCRKNLITMINQSIW